MNVQRIPRDPSLPVVPDVAPWISYACDCERPIPVSIADRLGEPVACARCERELPVRRLEAGARS